MNHESNAAVPDELGRLLFVRGPKALPRLMLWVGLCGMLFGAVAGPFAVMLDSDGLILASLLVPVAGFVVVLAVGGYARTLFVYEQGVAVQFLLRPRVLRYAEIAWYSEEAVAHFHNGVYQETVVDLEIVGLPAPRRRTLRFATKYFNQDLELEKLREHVSRAIARRMHGELRDEQTTPWTSSLRFVSGGLEYFKPGILLRAAPELIPFEHIDRYEIVDGKMRLFTTDMPGDKPKIVIPLSTENFYPGWRLLQALCPRE
jgi:hypothetical protein